MNIAVVDVGGNLVAFERMDNAWLGSINISQSKAFTAVAFNMTTEDLGKESQAGKSLFGIHTTNNGKIVIFGGGIPLSRNGVFSRCYRREWRSCPSRYRSCKSRRKELQVGETQKFSFFNLG